MYEHHSHNSLFFEKPRASLDLHKVCAHFTDEDTESQAYRTYLPFPRRLGLAGEGTPSPRIGLAQDDA